MSTKDVQTSSGANTGHIYVALRVRPLLEHEADRGETEAITIAPIKNFYPSNSLDEASSIARNFRSPFDSPLSTSKQWNERTTQPLRKSQSRDQESVKGNEASCSLKGGAHYAVQVHSSAIYRKQRLHLQKSSSLDQFGGPETASELFAFDAVLGRAATQTDVFDLLQLYTYCDDAMLEGKAAAIVCYGQTGSGKSFTMSGPLEVENDNRRANTENKKGNLQQDLGTGCKEGVLKEESGIAYQSVLYIAQCLQKLQQSVGSNSALRLVARASYVELYQERIHDLLQGRRDLKCRWSAERRVFYVEDLLQVECRTKEDFLLVLREGQSRRQQAAHMLNATSSRSHALFTINFETTTGDSRLKDAHCNSYIRYGKLTLVDLAGSERLKDTGNIANDDTKAINRSLFALSNVIQALSSAQPASATARSNKASSSCFSSKEACSVGRKNESNDQSIPPKGRNSVPMSSFVSYRSSVLTKLLMDSLEGNSRTLFIICVTPSSRFVEESLRTLQFAQRVRQIRSVAVERVDSQVKERRDFLRIISEMKEENTALRAALGIPSDARRPLSEERVKQYIEGLVSNRVKDMCRQRLPNENVSNRPPLLQHSKASQASCSPDPVRVCQENFMVQKVQHRDNKPGIVKMSDTDGSHYFASDSQQLPQLVQPEQSLRPFSSPPHHEFHEKDCYGENVNRCTPTPRQGYNALEILKSLPDTTSTTFNKQQRLVVSTRHLDPLYAASTPKKKNTTNANTLQKYGFHPQKRL